MENKNIKDTSDKMVFLQRQTRPIASPAVQGQQLPPPLVLFAEVFRHATADLREGAAHYFAEITLRRKVSLRSMDGLGASPSGESIPGTQY